MSEAEQDRDDRSQEEKLAELEAMAREQDRQSEESEKRHLKQMAELLDQAVEREAEQIGDVAKATSWSDGCVTWTC